MIDGPHTHPYPPDYPDQFTSTDDGFYFGGESEWVYLDGHPVPEDWGGGWCDLVGKHYHEYRPWASYWYNAASQGFVYVTDARPVPGQQIVRSVSGPPPGVRSVTPVAVQPLASNARAVPVARNQSLARPVAVIAARSTEHLPVVMELHSAPAAFPGVHVHQPDSGFYDTSPIHIAYENSRSTEVATRSYGSEAYAGHVSAHRSIAPRASSWRAFSDTSGTGASHRASRSGSRR